MYINVFINMANIFLHQKIVYRDLGTEFFFINTSAAKKVKYIY